jgi:uncharacterized delta-60 repeat protein
VYGMVLQPDSMIVAAGYSNNGSAKTYALARYDAQGTIDAGFGTGGKVTTALGSPDAYGASVALQTDGKIVVAGRANGTGNLDITVARYNGTVLSGISAGADNTGVSIWPNPAGERINIQMPASDDGGMKIVTLYNMQGGRLISMELEGPTSLIDISMLSHGLYYLVIDSPSGRIARKIVVE